MKEFFKKFKTPIKMFLFFIGILLLISLFNVFGVLGSTITAFLDMLVGVIFLFTLGIHFGKKREKRGFIAGLQVGFITIILLFLFSLIFFKVRFNIAMLIYYGILILSSVMGSMVGINKRKDEK